MGRNENPKRQEEILYTSKEDLLKDQVDSKKTSKTYFSLLKYKAVYYGLLFVIIILVLAVIFGVLLGS